MNVGICLPLRLRLQAIGIVLLLVFSGLLLNATSAWAQAAGNSVKDDGATVNPERDPGGLLLTADLQRE